MIAKNYARIAPPMRPPIAIRVSGAMLLAMIRKSPASAMMRLRRLSPERRRILPRTVMVLTAASAAVAFLPFRKALQLGCVALVTRARLSVGDCVWAVEAAARRLPWRTKCIEQGLAVQRLLRQSGVDARLHYGARHHPQSGKLEAHVWVTVGSETIIGGEEAAGFAEIAAYP